MSGSSRSCKVHVSRHELRWFEKVNFRRRFSAWHHFSANCKIMLAETSGVCIKICSRSSRHEYAATILSNGLYCSRALSQVSFLTILVWQERHNSCPVWYHSWPKVFLFSSEYHCQTMCWSGYSVFVYRQLKTVPPVSFRGMGFRMQSCTGFNVGSKFVSKHVAIRKEMVQKGLFKAHSRARRSKTAKYFSSDS